MTYVDSANKLPIKTTPREVHLVHAEAIALGVASVTILDQLKAPQRPGKPTEDIRLRYGAHLPNTEAVTLVAPGLPVLDEIEALERPAQMVPGASEWHARASERRRPDNCLQSEPVDLKEQ